MNIDGLYLEKSGEVIVWGMHAGDLRSVGQPEVVDTFPKHEFCWENEKVFGGLSASVYAILFGNQALRELRLETYNQELDKTVELHHSRLKSHLENALGQPCRSWQESYAVLPSYMWRIGNCEVVLLVFDRFGEYCILSVKNGAGATA